jgi:hypothetical protein
VWRNDLGSSIGAEIVAPLEAMSGSAVASYHDQADYLDPAARVGEGLSH